MVQHEVQLMCLHCNAKQFASCPIESQICNFMTVVTKSKTQKLMSACLFLD